MQSDNADGELPHPPWTNPALQLFLLIRGFMAADPGHREGHAPAPSDTYPPQGESLLEELLEGSRCRKCFFAFIAASLRGHGLTAAGGTLGHTTLLTA